MTESTPLAGLFSRPETGHPAVACRLALSSIAPDLFSREADEICAAFEFVYARWHAALEALLLPREQGAGWVAYARNCSPPFVRRKPPATTVCNKAFLCPFCWSRAYTLNLYERLSAASCVLSAAKQEPLQLVELAFEKIVAVSRTPTAVLQAYDFLRRVYEASGPRQLLKQAVGGYVKLSTEPAELGELPQDLQASEAVLTGSMLPWKLQARCLFLWPFDGQTAQIGARQDPFELFRYAGFVASEPRFSLLDRRRLLDLITVAVGRTTIYPANFLDPKFSEQTRHYYEAVRDPTKKRVRFSDTYGCLRSRSDAAS